MKIINKILLFSIVTLSLLYISSCDLLNSTSDEDCEYPDYSDCITEEPRDAYLKVKLTINEQNPEVKISLYNGTPGIDSAIYSFVSDTSNCDINVDFDISYTITANYIYNQDSIIAIDNTKITKYTSTNCDSTCWNISGDAVDLTLVAGY